MLNYEQQEKWSKIVPNWQSPINIETLNTINVDAKKKILLFDDEYRFVNIVNKGNNLQYDGKGKAIIEGREFGFQQLHFHFPAEHTINGKEHPMELHFVHQNMIGQIAVVALFVKLGEFSKELDSFFQDFPAIESEKDPFSATLGLNSLIASLESGVYHYLGSLTTPPLVKNVEWWVIEKPITVSAEQLDKLKQRFNHGNAREKQPLNERKVIHYSLI
ncbi:carbonic anhydrase family protein [Liquorilactobacillus hordei]|uniref:carbonic anhydrase n=1 Tax=Liquorilactobacillus hordei TaxID=468911 RepID=A0A3Q8C8H1_9LACO|nr:carbonic anhydrase family protein [Liquorilactobacillus hordei]AUJ28902.1 carbonate dehydratase [Liquorilactobacillus hordei]MBZ2406301.1 carbonate dehydratase [Liquorilactobacillus hordei]